MDTFSALLAFEKTLWRAPSKRDVAMATCQLLYDSFEFDECCVAYAAFDGFRVAGALRRQIPAPDLLNCMVKVDLLFPQSIPDASLAREQCIARWDKTLDHPLIPGKKVKHLVAVPTWLGNRCEALIVCWDFPEHPARAEERPWAPALPALLCSHIAHPIAKERELANMRGLANRIAHLTSTPIVIARHELEELQKDMR